MDENEKKRLEEMRLILSRTEQRLFNEISLIKSSFCRISKRIHTIENFLQTQFGKEFGIVSAKTPFSVETAEKILGKVQIIGSGYRNPEDVARVSSPVRVDFDGDNSHDSGMNDKVRSSSDQTKKQLSTHTLKSSTTIRLSGREEVTDDSHGGSDKDNDDHPNDSFDPDYKSSESDTDSDCKSPKKRKRSGQYGGSANKSSLRCTICGKIFKGDTCLDTLRDHIEKEHSSTRRELHCEFCNASFAFQLTLNDHLKERERQGGSCPTKTSNDPLKFLCCICGKTFTGPRAKRSYKEHLESHETETKYKCSICDKGFTQRRYLSRHSIKHAKVQPQTVCHICGKVYLGVYCKRNLQRHLDNHADEKMYKCRYCEETFQKHSAYRYHVASKHEKNQHTTHSCKYCEKEFLAPSELRQHERIHTGERPHQCYVCGKGFTQKTNLDIHIAAMHKEACNGPKLNCPECDKVFLHQTSLNVHMKFVHTRNKKLEGSEDVVKCGKCSAAFSNRRILKIHETKTHPSPSSKKPHQTVAGRMSKKLVKKSKTKSNIKPADGDTKTKPELIETAEIITTDISDSASINSDD